MLRQSQNTFMAIKPMSGNCHLSIIQWASSLTVDLEAIQQRGFPVATPRLPSSENVVQTQNEVMKQNRIASQSTLGNDVPYYKQTFQESPRLTKLRLWGD